MGLCNSESGRYLQAHHRQKIDFNTLPPSTKASLLQDLDHLQISTRTRNALKANSINCIGELARFTEEEISKFRNIGRNSIEEINRLIEKHAITLNTEIENLPEAYEIKKLDSSSFREKCQKTHDFNQLDGVSKENLLQPLGHFNLSTRTKNALRSENIKVLGELIRMNSDDLKHIPNIGRKSFAELELLLHNKGYEFGEDIIHWPDDAELDALIELNDVGSTLGEAIPGGPYSILEEEIRAAVEYVVSASRCQVLLRRTGWDGGQKHTLVEIAESPQLSGRSHVVTRERIRQIESSSRSKLKKQNLEMPCLDQVLNLLTQCAPFTSTKVAQLLRKHGLTRAAFSIEQIFEIARTFGRKCKFCVIDGKDFKIVVPVEISNEFQRVRDFVLERTRITDYVARDEIAIEFKEESFDVNEITNLLLRTDPYLDWLDADKGIIWSRTRRSANWNKALNVCAKILWLTNEMSLLQLHQSVSKSRNVVNVPSKDTLLRMLDQDQRFIVKGDSVSLTDRKYRVSITSSDLALIRASSSIGPVVRFKDLREYLVREGMSTGHAQLVINLSPLLTRISWGRYRFVCSPEEAKSSLLALQETNPNRDMSVDRLKEIVEITVSNHTMYSGKYVHRNSRIGSRNWKVLDITQSEIGQLRTNDNQLLDLNALFKQESIAIGVKVILEFDSTDDTVTLVLQ